MGRIHPASVLLGVITDKLAFIVGAIALTLLVGIESRVFAILVLPLGFATIAIGGFVAAWHARSDALGHGIAVGIMGTIISFSRFAVNALSPPRTAAAFHPLWWELLNWVGAPVAGLIGAWLAARRARRSPVDRLEPIRWAWWIPVYIVLIALFALAEQF